MFHRDCWAGAFFTVSGENAESVFLCLKTLARPLQSIRGAFFGHSASVKIEKILRESASAAKTGAPDFALEYAIRFICLLVERKCFRYIDSLLKKIEQMLNERKKIIDVTVEAAASPDSGFEEELTQMLKQKMGASAVKVKTEIKPELLGGYLLRIGDFYVDASLKGQLENMKAELITAVEEMSDGGNNGEL